MFPIPPPEPNEAAPLAPGCGPTTSSLNFYVDSLGLLYQGPRETTAMRYLRLEGVNRRGETVWHSCCQDPRSDWQLITWDRARKILYRFIREYYPRR